MREIRNFLTHQRSSEYGYPVVVTRRSLQALREIHQELRSPTPVSNDFRKPVDCVAADDSLGAVLQTAFDKGYSQFPVLADDKFVGLITGNEITRWLGLRTSQNGGAVDLHSVTVKTALEQQDPFREPGENFHFSSPDDPVEEVMGLFATRPTLEAVLLTEGRNRRKRIQGIITQWDAARFTRTRANAASDQ